MKPVSDNIDTAARLGALRDPAIFLRVYWGLRFGVAFVWLWTAYVSWFEYPHAESIGLLRASGFVTHTEQVFAASCVVDLAMGLASLAYARSLLWWTQCAIVVGYSIVICVRLPEAVMHPFGPISKNVCVLACMAILALADRRQDKQGRARLP